MIIPKRDKIVKKDVHIYVKKSTKKFYNTFYVKEDMGATIFIDHREKNTWIKSVS